jgi:hypothetical protein
MAEVMYDFAQEIIMQNLRVMLFIIIFFVATPVFIVSFFYCNSPIQRADAEKKINEDDSFKEVFSKEGFISRDLFRVVIVKPAESEGNNISQVEILGKKRAYMTLKNHLLSLERIITPNVDAKLLNLVSNYGKVRSMDKDTITTRNVFYFEIEKENLKDYIERIAQHR